MEMLLAPQNLPFSLALVAVVILGALQLLLGIGDTVDVGVDVDGDIDMDVEGERAACGDGDLGAFAQHQSVAVHIKGPGGELRRRVFGAGGEQGVKHCCLRGIELFCAARQHGQLLSALDGFKSIAQALASRGAGAGRGDDSARRTEEHAMFTGAVCDIILM